MTIGNALNAAFAANQLIYASSATQLIGLATATNAILVTNSGGIPSFQATIPLLVQQNITELGAIASIGAPLNQQFGGTGVNNTGTITLGGSLTTTGAYNSTFNMTGATSVTFPTSGVLATTVGVGVLTVSGTLNKISCTGGQNPVLSIDPNYVGQTSITTLGTITTGVFEGSIIGLAYGGTNANLTASNGGIFYSTASAAAILSGIATANKVLLSGSNTAPTWSTAVYPSSTTANQLLYSSANNTITGLATAADGVLVTNIDGIPSISGTLPSAVQQGITELGTITYMIEPLGAAFGGTGVDNGTSTITLADSLTTTGAYPVTFNFTGNTDLTFPLSGTLATVAGIPSLPLITSQGGSGLVSPTAHGILVSEGSSPFNPIVLGAGQLLIGTTAGDPVAATLTQGTALTITSTTGAITIGVTSNPALPGAAGVTLPQGNTAARSGGAGTMRFNTQTSVFEGTVDGSTWAPFTTSALGVLSVGGTPGFITSTGGSTPIIDIDSTYVGQTSITTVGTITSGTWTGSTINVPYGGTGATSLTQYSVLLGNGTGAIQTVSGLGTSGYVLTSNGAGSAPTWQAGAPTGVTSNIATANQTTVSSATGAVTIGLANNAILPGTGGITLPQGNVAARSGGAGTMRFNSQSGVFEGTVDGTNWAAFESSATGVVSVGGTVGFITCSPNTGSVIVDIDPTYVGQTSITTLGTITTGTWTGTIIGSAYGGTGVNNGSNTITLGGNFTTSGAYNTTLVVTGNTSVTLPTSGTLVNSAVTTLSSLSSVGTISTGSWGASVISPTYGGTGVNNGASTITLGGNFATSGAYAATLSLTGATNVTLPTSGTLATTSSIPTFPLSLANGGLNANLTANNGGVFYSTGSAGAILSGTSTSNQILQSGSNSAPTWSTATYPASTTASQLLYSSSNNTIAGLPTANNGILVTNGTGVPSIGITLPTAVQGNITQTGTITNGAWNGSLITGTYGGTGVNNGAYTITLGGSISTAGGLTLSGAYGSTFTFSNTTSVTFPTSGTLATTSQIPSFPLSLANGGTAANLAASTGGIVYSGASAFAVLSGTSTANQILMSGSSAAPSWSTATYPTTTTANDILYSSATNTIGQISTANNGVLITSSGGVPSISSTLPSAVQGNITSTGTIASGTWNGSAVGVAYGGTGNTSTTAYAVLCGGTTSTGALQPIASVGTSGQVLTSNGAGALPTFQAASGGGGNLVYIATATASNSASLAFTNVFSSTYSQYLFVFNQVLAATNGVIFYAQLGTGSTPTYVTTNYVWNNLTCILGSLYDTYGTSDSQIAFTRNGGGAYNVGNTGVGVNGSLWINGTNGSSNAAAGSGFLSYTSQEPAIAISYFGWSQPAAIFTAIKFYMSSGNITSGSISVYGISI